MQNTKTDTDSLEELGKELKSLKEVSTDHDKQLEEIAEAEKHADIFESVDKFY